MMSPVQHQIGPSASFKISVFAVDTVKVEEADLQDRYALQLNHIVVESYCGLSNWTLGLWENTWSVRW